MVRSMSEHTSARWLMPLTANSRLRAGVVESDIESSFRSASNDEVDVAGVEVLVEAGDPPILDAHDDARRNLDVGPRPVGGTEDVLLHEAGVREGSADL